MYDENSPQPTQQDRPIFGLPVDTTLLFADKKGNYKKSLEAKRTKLLKKVTFLRDFLDPDERIVFVTSGCSPFSVLEAMTIGHLWIYLIKRALFVFTNKRILHIPTTSSFQYRHSVAQILYQDCRSLYVKGGALRVEYTTGKKENFLGIPRSDGEIIKQISIEAPEPAEPSTWPERNHLCPSCTQVLGAGRTTCPSCGLAFKTKADAVRYSLLLPGGGYFYTRHWVMGVLDAIGETYLLVLMLLALAVSVLADPTVFPGFLLASGVLAIEKCLTVYHAKGFVAEFIPRTLPVQPAARRLPAEQPPAEQPPAASEPQPNQTVEQVLSVR
jgi:hypothetical protein